MVLVWLPPNLKITQIYPRFCIAYCDVTLGIRQRVPKDLTSVVTEWELIVLICHNNFLFVLFAETRFSSPSRIPGMAWRCREMRRWSSLSLDTRVHATSLWRLTLPSTTTPPPTDLPDNPLWISGIMKVREQEFGDGRKRTKEKMESWKTITGR